MPFLKDAVGHQSTEFGDSRDKSLTDQNGVQR